MSAFNTVAAAATKNVAGAFGMAAHDVTGLKAGVVAGLRQSLGQSYGHDVAFEQKFDM